MLSGIRNEILDLNKDYIESFKNTDADQKQVTFALAKKLLNKIQAFLDFLYRDNNLLFEALKKEAEEAKTKDSIFETEYNKNLMAEISEFYIDFCLTPAYQYRGDVFNSIFYGDKLN